jgi:hypothetical protein
MLRWQGEAAVYGRVEEAGQLGDPARAAAS